MEQEFQNLAKFLSIVANNGSTLAKKGLLIRFKELPDLQLVLKHLYNPYVTTGIKDRSLDDAYWGVIGTVEKLPFDTLYNVIAYLQENNTGSGYKRVDSLNQLASANGAYYYDIQSKNLYIRTTRNNTLNNISNMEIIVQTK